MRTRQAGAEVSPGKFGQACSAVNIYWIDSNACFPRRTFSMMASGSAVQVKGLGLSLVSARYRLMGKRRV
jgi:hypothetical protein